jgi:hypothetical protein
MDDLSYDGTEHYTQAGVIIKTPEGRIIPHQALIKNGFLRIKPKLYSKKITEKITLYHDYRVGERRSYAFEIGKAVDHTIYNEFSVIIEAEAIAKDEMASREQNETHQ